MSAAGRYCGIVENVIAVSVGRRIGIRFGKALMHALADAAAYRPGSMCRFDIDPDAVRVWPLHDARRQGSQEEKAISSETAR
jgi:hypothetical protein